MALDFSRCQPVPVLQDDGTTLLMPPPPHVKAGVEWLLERRCAIQGNDMGGMKSAQAVLGALFLFERQEVDRVIVVAPAAVRPAVWYDPVIGELALHLWDDVPSLVTEYHAKIRQWRRGPWADAVALGKPVLKWIVTNYEWLRRKDKWQTLIDYCGPKTLLVLDESSSIRSHNSDQTEACMALRWNGPFWKAKPRCGRVWLLNGTPLAEGPEDLFSQGNMMNPSIHGCRYITHFRNAYAVMEDVRGTGGRTLTDNRGNTIRRVAGWRNLEDLQARFEPYVLRQDWRKDFPLPGVMPTQTLTVPLSADLWKAYRDMRDDMVHWLQSGGVAVSKTAATKVMRLAQITSGIVGGVEEDEATEASEHEDLMRSLGLWNEEPHGTAVVEEVQQMIGALQRDRETSDAYTFADIEAAKNTARPGAHAIDKLATIGRDKLDYFLELHDTMLREDPNLKLLVWCRFVPELRRLMHELREKHPMMNLGAVCGASIWGQPVRYERDVAMKLLHPRTSPDGPAVVGGTYGTGALGLNFTAFSTVVNLSHVYEDWKRRQADKRVDRPGQRKVVTQFDIVAVGPRGQKTIDHVIIAARREKQDLNDWTVAAWVKALKDEE